MNDQRAGASFASSPAVGDAPPGAAAGGFCHPLDDKTGTTLGAVLELRVRNHPGTMSHITGLFARRAFNLEAIICAPVGDGTTSCILLLVAREPRLDQVERQLARLHDVLAVRLRPDLDASYFARLVAAPFDPVEKGNSPGRRPNLSSIR